MNTWREAAAVAVRIPAAKWITTLVPPQRDNTLRGLSVGSIRNPNRAQVKLIQKYALDARAVSRLSFELWTSKPRIRTS